MVMYFAVEYSYLMIASLFFVTWRVLNGPLIPGNFIERFLLIVMFYQGVFQIFVGIEYIIAIITGVQSLFFTIVSVLSIAIGFYLVASVMASPGKMEIVRLCIPLALAGIIYLIYYLLNLLAGINLLEIILGILEYDLTKIAGIGVLVILLISIVIPDSENILWSSEKLYNITMNKAWIIVAAVATIESLLIARGTSFIGLILGIAAI